MAATPVPASQFQQLRILAGFTQAGLSDLWGVHRVTIARWESGALPVPAWATRLSECAPEATTSPVLARLANDDDLPPF